MTLDELLAEDPNDEGLPFSTAIDARCVMVCIRSEVDSNQMTPIRIQKVRQWMRFDVFCHMWEDDDVRRQVAKTHSEIESFLVSIEQKMK